MNIFDSIGKVLDTNITEYKATAKRVSFVAAEDCPLAPYEIEQLVEANAKAEASMQVRNIISQALAYAQAPGKDEATAQLEAVPRIVRMIEDRMDIVLRQKETHVAALRIYASVLRAIRDTEQDRIAASK